MDQEHQIRTFKDFLYFYNVMSETCFKHCVNNLNSRELDEKEVTCVDWCANKFINCNNRLIKIYANVQEKIVNKRIQALEEEKLKEDATNHQIVQPPAVIET